MTSKECFLTALNGGIPDRIPIAEHLFSLKLRKAVLGYNIIFIVNDLPEMVRAEVRDYISIGLPDGGYIIVTDHSIHDDILTENVFAFIEAVKEYGQYPISL